MKKSWLGCLMVGAGFGVAAWCVGQSRREEEVFRELLRGLTFGPNPQEVLKRIAERSAKLIGGSEAYVERLDGDELIVAAVHDGRDLPVEGIKGPYKGSVAEQAI